MIEHYEKIMNQIQEYNDSIKSDTYKCLNHKLYINTIKTYQEQLFNFIKRNDNLILLIDKKKIYEILFNICIISLNYLAIIYNIELTEIMKTNRNLFEKKNNDYGNSFQDYGLIGILVRLNDKINRLKMIYSLLDNENNCLVNDERFEDTINDLYNYTIIGLMYKCKNFH